MSPTPEERLCELEFRLAHQEEHLQTLNDTVNRQQRELEALHTRMETLRQRLAEVMALGSGQEPGPEPPPPHY
ncbi:MAG: SlyX family protein [Ectothiorhodospira sp.]